jgi:hypothetical protein
LTDVAVSVGTPLRLAWILRGFGDSVSTALGVDGHRFRWRSDDTYLRFEAESDSGYEQGGRDDPRRACDRVWRSDCEFRARQLHGGAFL